MTRKRIINLSTLLVLTSALFAGCSKKDDSVQIAPPPPAPESSGVDLSASSSSTAPTAAPGPGATAPVQAPKPTVDFAKTERPVNDKGDPMSDLEYLNQLVFDLNESRVSGGQEVDQKTFKTEAEQMAYEEAHQKKMQPVHSLQELVDAGILKAVPQAPNGQHYTIDPATGKVVVQ